MSRKLALLLAAACAVAVLGAAARGAAGFEMSITPAGRFSMVSRGKVTFGEGPWVECNLTLRGTLAPTATIASRAHMGHVTEATFRNCEGGTLERVLGLPWPIQFESASGTLPSSLEALYVNIENIALNLSTFFELVNCLYSGLYRLYIAAAPWILRKWALLFVIILPENALELAFARGSGLCPGELPADGEFSLVPSQTVAI